MCCDCVLKAVAYRLLILVKPLSDLSCPNYGGNIILEETTPIIQHTTTGHPFCSH